MPFLVPLTRPRSQSYTSFEHPVWKQEPGDTYIYFLQHACTDALLCGVSLAAATAMRGPAWVSGLVLGSSTGGWLVFYGCVASGVSHTVQQRYQVKEFYKHRH
jgi:hypothetical protein